MFLVLVKKGIDNSLVPKPNEPVESDGGGGGAYASLGRHRTVRTKTKRPFSAVSADSVCVLLISIRDFC